MRNYEDIIKRIDEIINISSQRKSELSVEDLKNYNDFFVRKLWKDIAIEYAEEMQELLDVERTFYLVKNGENITINNEELNKLCQNHIKSSKENETKYLRLIEILNNCVGKSVLEVTEFNGYFILKSELLEFISLCRELNVGPYRLIKDMTSEEVKEYIDNNLKNLHDQNKRINVSLNKISNDKQLTVQTTALKVEEKPLVIDTPIFLNGKYKEFVYLGLIGQLDLKTIYSLKDILTNEEFEELILELNKWQIFSEEELSKINKSIESGNKVISNVDELIGYFALKKNLNIEGLKLLIPTIGLYNFKYMVNRLFELGAINIEDYFAYLEFKNNINKKA